MTSVQQKRYNLIELLFQIDDYSILENIEVYLGGHTKNEVEDTVFTKEQLELFERSSQEIEEGNYVTADEAIAKGRALLERLEKESKSKK